MINILLLLILIIVCVYGDYTNIYETLCKQFFEMLKKAMVHHTTYIKNIYVRNAYMCILQTTLNWHLSFYDCLIINIAINYLN